MFRKWYELRFLICCLGTITLPFKHIIESFAISSMFDPFSTLVDWGIRPKNRLQPKAEMQVQPKAEMPSVA